LAGEERRYHPTAQAVAGEVAALAYSVHRTVSGPNGEWHQAFVICSRDAGATWSCLPLVRTMWSCLRFWGYPVWPPEEIDAVTIERGVIGLGFRDEEVPFEPGGESRWTGRRSLRGLWTVARVRYMDYDGADRPISPPPIAVNLPAGFGAPPSELLDNLASALAADTRLRIAGRFGWLLAFPAGAFAFLLGESWWLLAIAMGLLFGLWVTTILAERRRHRRTVSFP
jgi:hypothetical protein